MQLIGITGAIGHGKTSLANAISLAEPSTLHLESGELITEIAEALNNAAVDIPTADLPSINLWLEPLASIVHSVCQSSTAVEQFRVTASAVSEHPDLYKKLFDYLDILAGQAELLHERITIENKALLRPLLQWLGSYIPMHSDPSIWFDELVRRAHAADQRAICVIGGVRYISDAETIRNAGGKIVAIERPDIKEADVNDPTERERKDIVIDITVVNDGTMANLEYKAERFVHDLANDSVTSLY